MPVTALKQVAMPELLAMFDPQTQEKIKEQAKGPKVSHVVVFENLDMCSSHLGERTALVIGPGCTYKSVDDIREGHLGQVPSVFKYPVCYAEI